MDSRVACLLLGAVAACGGDSSGQPDAGDACPVPVEARAILAAETTRQSIDGSWIVFNSHPGSDRGYARNLMGSSDAHMGSLTPIGPCTEPVTYDPYCECEAPPCDFPVRCSQLGCAAAGHTTLEVWWENLVPYVAGWTDPAGATVGYQGNPTTGHDYVEGSADLAITWQADDAVRVTVGDADVDLSSTLAGAATSNLDGPVSMSIDLYYTGLGALLHIERGAATPYQGTLEVDGVTLADVVQTGTEELPALVWRAPCD